MSQSLTDLFGIQYPIVQAGMVWCSGWRLASAVSNAGGLGLIGAGSMYPDVLRAHIRACKAATNKPFGVNVPLLYPDIETHMNTIVEEGVPIVFSSAGNPATWTGWLRDRGVTVVHVVSNTRFARKAVDAGAQAVVAEGFEAGGHNGREETTTMVLVPMVADAVPVPVIAAGGISSGRAMAAAFCLGAKGVQVGTRFAAAAESSAHDEFKARITQVPEGGTELVMKQSVPVRLIKNAFYNQIKEAELRGASTDELHAILGRGRAKLGMFEGNLEEGELEIGQVAAMVKGVEPAAAILMDIWEDYLSVRAGFGGGIGVI